MAASSDRIGHDLDAAPAATEILRGPRRVLPPPPHPDILKIGGWECADSARGTGYLGFYITVEFKEDGSFIRIGRVGVTDLPLYVQCPRCRGDRRIRVCTRPGNDW